MVWSTDLFVRLVSRISDPGREAFRDINSKWQGKDLSPLELLRELFNTSMVITSVQSDPGSVASELVQASPHILRTLILCNPDIDLYRRSAETMNQFVDRLDTQEGKLLFMQHLPLRKHDHRLRILPLFNTAQDPAPRRYISPARREDFYGLRICLPDATRSLACPCGTVWSYGISEHPP